MRACASSSAGGTSGADAFLSDSVVLFISFLLTGLRSSPFIAPAEMLDNIAEHLLQKALAGKPPEMVNEVRRRIEAGETVTVESLADVIEGQADDPAQNEPREW